MTGITYTVSELEEVSEEDIPACANVNDGCGVTEAAADPECAGGEYWNGDECTKCEANKYMETGVYASASGASNDKGCKPCGADASLVNEIFASEDYDSWNNKDEIIASLIKTSPAGSEGADSCVANCKYGNYWDGEDCVGCPPDFIYGFVDYEESATNGGMDYPVAKYNSKKAWPKSGDGVDQSVCTPCSSLNMYYTGSTATPSGNFECAWVFGV